uniref:Uncharacterized protein n=1 Tax=Arundo donax TaxID=35708 RepID=A0A0A9HSE7_ARUDO
MISRTCYQQDLCIKYGMSHVRRQSNEMISRTCYQQDLCIIFFS